MVYIKNATACTKNAQVQNIVIVSRGMVFVYRYYLSYNICIAFSTAHTNL